MYFVVVPSFVAGCVIGNCQFVPFCVIFVCDRILWGWDWSDDWQDPCVCSKWTVFIFPHGEDGVMTSRSQDWWWLQVQDVFFHFFSILSWHQSSVDCWLRPSYSLRVMVTIRNQHHPSPSLGASKGQSLTLSNVEPMVLSDEAFQPTSAYEIATWSYILYVGFFDDMKEETWGGVQDRFYGRAETTSLQNWKIWFRL